MNNEYEGFPYMTIAIAIGCEKKEIDEFLKIFLKTYNKVIKEMKIN